MRLKFHRNIAIGDISDDNTVRSVSYTHLTLPTKA